jgi:hypothetical protein
MEEGKRREKLEAISQKVRKKKKKGSYFKLLLNNGRGSTRRAYEI